MSDQAIDSGFRLSGWHVLAILLGMFGTVIAVNVVFAWLALKTFSGEQDHAYVEGLRFNERLAAEHRQAEAGWQMALSLQRGAGGDAQLLAAMTQRDGTPLTGATMTGTLGRPATDGQDRALTFREVEPGLYAADLGDFGPGRWVFRAEARRAGDPPFMTETRVSLR